MSERASAWRGFSTHELERKLAELEDLVDSGMLTYPSPAERAKISRKSGPHETGHGIALPTTLLFPSPATAMDDVVLLSGLDRQRCLVEHGVFAAADALSKEGAEQLELWQV